MVVIRPVIGHPGVRVLVDERVPGQQNECPGIANVPGRTAVVINNSRLALQQRLAHSMELRYYSLQQKLAIRGAGGREWVRLRELGGGCQVVVTTDSRQRRHCQGDTRADRLAR